MKNRPVVEQDAAAIAAVTRRGCNPLTNDRICPDDSDTQGHVAAFMNRSVPK